MKYGSEVLAIIEAGLEGNKEKVRAYAKLLSEKLPDDDEHMRMAIRHRLDGSYKNQPTLQAVCQTCKEKEGKPRVDNGLACGTHCDDCFEKMVTDARSRSW